MRAALPLAVLLSGVAGCEILLDLLSPDRTRVVLDNRGEFPVEVTLFTSSQQDIPEAILTADDDDAEEFTIPAGESISFTRSCSDLQAIIIDDADLQVVGQVGPSDDTSVLRDGDDFGCGDTITFIFEHSAVLIDFNISIDVDEPGPGD